MRQRQRYSARLGLWRLQQDSPFFLANFAKHATAAKAAEEAGDDRLLSYHNKMSTKGCRFAPAIDGLLKGWRQLKALQKWQERKVEEAQSTADKET